MRPGSVPKGQVQCGTTKCIVRSKQAQTRHTFCEDFPLQQERDHVLFVQVKDVKGNLQVMLQQILVSRIRNSQRRHQCLQNMISSMK